ncbi:MAG: hypothetical protein HZB87_08495 [Desulfatitalea sp.]|nr:hypothetical protein [Desulfatitalea sp.]MBI5895512.1 hypothetical protein [Desulfobacterales bacterium]
MPKEKKSAPKEIKITGIVEELELDDDDIGLQIVDNARTYRVAMDKQGRKLLDYVDEEIEATGIITKTEEASEIKIARFHLVDEATEEEDEDEDEAWPDDDDDFMSERDDD